MIYFVHKMVEKNADISYNGFWLGLSACGEMSMGIIVTSTLTLPKFFQVHCKSFRSGISKVFDSWTSHTATNLTASQDSGKRINRLAQGQTLSEIDLMDLDNEVV